MQRVLEEVTKMLASEKIPCNRIGFCFEDIDELEVRIYAYNSTVVRQCQTIIVGNKDAKEVAEWLKQNCEINTARKNSWHWFVS